MGATMMSERSSGTGTSLIRSFDDSGCLAMGQDPMFHPVERVVRGMCHPPERREARDAVVGNAACEVIQGISSVQAEEVRAGVEAATIAITVIGSHFARGAVEAFADALERGCDTGTAMNALLLPRPRSARRLRPAQEGHRSRSGGARVRTRPVRRPGADGAEAQCRRGGPDQRPLPAVWLRGPWAPRGLRLALPSGALRVKATPSANVLPEGWQQGPRMLGGLDHGGPRRAMGVVLEMPMHTRRRPGEPARLGLARLRRQPARRRPTTSTGGIPARCGGSR